MAVWNATEVSDQRGRTAVVTGGNTGVGFEVARFLANRGATVVLACRDLSKAAGAAERIRAEAPTASIEVLELDLASLASVRRAAQDFRAGHNRLDLLFNNAGVMRTPNVRTEDGFELQLATNHLGHFAWTGLVLERLLAAPDSRVVTVSSPAHRQGRFADPEEVQRYRAGAAYARSKLANLLFAYEFQRRLAAAGARTISLAAHPGGARTELNRHMPALALAGGKSWGIWRPITHTAEHGALPLLRAATDSGAHGGEYYRPDGFMEFRGAPAPGKSSDRSHDPRLQQDVWEASERQTGVHYDLSSLNLSEHAGPSPA